MRKNLPVTQREILLDDLDTIVTKTDLKGAITYANPDFVRISGFSLDELIGQNHNIVRHPEMPPSAFADLWQTLRKGRPWNGLVKNRCKNGDYYWVNAYVAPIEENGQVVGYTSMRTKPSREQVAQAEHLYRELSGEKARFALDEGRVVSTGLLARINPQVWIRRLKARTLLHVMLGMALAGFLVICALNQRILGSVQVNGPLYQQISLGKELVADILPPPEYLVESWQVALEMLAAEPAELPVLAEKSRLLRQEYESRHQYWSGKLPPGEIRSLIVDASWKSGVKFHELLAQQFIPALLAGDRATALAILPELKVTYSEHRRAIDAAVKLANARNATIEESADAEVADGNTRLIALSLAIALLIVVLERCIQRNLTRSGDPDYLAEVIRHVAVGNLAIRINTEGGGGESVLHVVRQLQARLRVLIRIVSEKADSLVTEARQMADASDHVSIGVQGHSQSTSAVAATSEQLTASIQSVTQNTQEALVISNRSSAACEQGAGVIHSAVASMERIALTVRQTSEAVLALGAQSEHISSVVQVIGDIADQTNLLALNAAIEAARAGEHGRGFAVVADEVRKLAERTSVATKEIENVICAIQSGLQVAVTDMGSGVRQVNEGVALANEAGTSISNIREGAQQMARFIAEIADALTEQATASSSIADHVERIAHTSEENSAVAQQTSLAAGHLEDAARQLQNSVSRFVV